MELFVTGVIVGLFIGVLQFIWLKRNTVGLMHIDYSKDDHDRYRLEVTKHPDDWKQKRHIIFKVETKDLQKEQ